MGKGLVRSEGGRTIWNTDRLFDDFFRRSFGSGMVPALTGAATMDIMPDIDVYEDNGNVVVKAEIPGMKKEDIEVTLLDGKIKICGEKKEEKEVENKDYYQCERSYGSFSRILSLPAEVQADKVTSTYKDGILEVKMPKTEQAKSKEVKVKVA
ncbi:MAG: Hsp20/alpha crystallin family protein [Smithellaceae bacterium]